MFQKQVVVGRLTRDPESKTYGDNTVCRFSVAVDDGFGDKKTTDFFNCSAWGKTGANVQQYTKKGSLVLVEGKMKSSKKEDRTYWELRADMVKFLSSNHEGQQNQSQGGQYQQPQQTAAQGIQYQQPMQQQYVQYQQPMQQQYPQYQQPQQQQQQQFPGAGAVGNDDLPF